MGNGFGEVRREFVDRSASAVNRYAGKVDTVVGDVSKAATAVNALSSFQGGAADAVKAYWSEAQSLVATALGVASQQLGMQVTLYASGYDSVDPSGGAWFNEGTLNDTATWAKGAISTAADGPVSRYMQVVNDPEVQKLVSEKAYGIARLSSESVDGKVQDLGTKASNLRTAVQSYEDAEAGKVPSVSNLVNNATQAMASLGSYASGKAYTPGQVQNESWYGPLVTEMIAASTWQKNNAAAYKKALKGFNTRMNQRVTIRANSATNRMKRGRSETLKAGINVTIGGVLIVADLYGRNFIGAAAATPSELFQISDLAEGISDWYQGAHGKDGHSMNVARHFLFGDDQKKYDAWEIGSGFAAGAIGVTAKFEGVKTLRDIVNKARAGGVKAFVNPEGRSVESLIEGLFVDQSGIFVASQAAPVVGDLVQTLVSGLTGNPILGEAAGDLASTGVSKGTGKLAGKAGGKVASRKGSGEAKEPAGGSKGEGPSIPDPQGNGNEHFGSPNPSSPIKPQGPTLPGANSDQTLGNQSSKGQTPPKGHATPKRPKPPVSSSPHPKTNAQKKKDAKKRKMKKNSQRKNKKK